MAEQLRSDPILVDSHVELNYIPVLDDNLKKFFENSPTGFWIVNPIRLRQEWCNSVVVKLFNKKSMQDFQGIDLSSTTLRVQLRMQNIVQGFFTDSHQTIPWTMYPDGMDPVTLELRVSGISVQNELCVLCQVISIVDKDVEEGNRLTHMAREAFEFCPAMLSITNMEGDFLLKNAAADYFFREYSNTPKNLLKILFRGIENSGTCYEQITEHVKSGKIYNGQVQLYSVPDGDECWHSISICKQRNINTSGDVLVVSQIDITDSKQKDKIIQNMKLSKYLKQRYKAVEKLRGRIEEPLIGVITKSTSLATDNELFTLLHTHVRGDEFDQSIQEMQQLSTNLLDLVSHLLEVSKAPQNDDNQDIMFWEAFSLSSILGAVCLEYQVPYTTNTVQFNLPQDIHRFTADRKSFKALIQILVRYAVHSTKRSNITLQIQNCISGSLGCVVFQIPMPGLCHEQLDLLFDLPPDTIIDNQLEDMLKTSKRIVEKHGGSIVAMSAEKGCTIMFSMPNRPDLV